ncbi:MAG: class I SAM-dependent methyltransferase [Phycisphaerae bacterium]
MRWQERWLLSTPLRGWLLRKIEVPRVLNSLPLPAGTTCLEIGCGNGVGALAVAQRLRTARLVCVDSDAAMLDRARKVLARPPRWAGDVDTGRIEPVCADATRLPLADASFDAAFLFGVLHHIRQWPAAIREVHRVLKPAGVFAFEEALMGRSRLLANRFWRHVPFGLEKLYAALREASFHVERFETALGGGWCFVQARKSV